MEKKKWVKLAGLAMVFLLSLFLCVGCADNSAEDCDEVTFIDFSRESAVSRGIESWNEYLYPPESLYWTYTAKKIRGNYTTGQTALGEKRPVIKNGPAKGLGAVGPFSMGVWEFNLYGYTKCTVNSTTGELVFADADLVYTGKTGTEEHNYTTIDKRPNPNDEVQKIVFELTPTTFWNFLEGQLAISNVHLTVPENQRFTIDSSTTSPVRTFVKTTVSIVSIPSGATAGGTAITVLPFVLAESLTEITEEKISGADVALDGFGAFKTTGASNEFTPGMYEFEFKAEYKDVFTTDSTDAPQYAPDGWAQIGKISTYPIEIKAGVKTTISGDINDIQVAEDGKAHNEKFYGAVAKILNTTKTSAAASNIYDLFYSLGNAFTAYGSSDDYKTSGVANPIIIIHDIEDAGTLTPATDGVVVKVTDENGNRHFIEKLVVSGTTNRIVFKLANTGRDYVFSAKDASTASKIVNLSYDGTASGGNVWLHTENGTLDVDAAGDSVYHTGKADSVTLTAVAKTDTSAVSPVAKGYFLGTAKTGANPETSVSALDVKAGSLNIGGQAAIETLTVGDGSSAVTVCGRTTSYVGNIDKIRDNDSSVVNDTNRDVFKTVTLNVNGGTGTSPVTKYGIEGMYMNLVDNTAVSFTEPSGFKFNCWNTKDNRTGDDYSAAGKIAVVKDGSGNYPVLYAVWGYPIAKIETIDAGVYTYFGTLHDAVEKYGTDSYGGTSSPNPIVLLRNVDTDSIAPAGTVKINPNRFSLKNITVTNTNTVEIDVATDRVYAFGGFADNKLDEFSYVGNEVAVKTTGGTLTVNAENDNVVHTGTVVDVTLEKVADDVADSKGYHLAATASGTVTLTQGFLEIDGNISTLNVTSATGVSLKGRAGTNAVVTVCKFSGTQRNTWSTSGTEYAPYKQVVLNGNGGTLKVTTPETATGTILYMNYVEGLELTLPDVSTSTAPTTVPSGTKIRKWNTEVDVSGYDVTDKSDIVVAKETPVLYGCWAVAKMLKSDDSWDYFKSFADAVAKHHNPNYQKNGADNNIILLENIDSAGNVVPTAGTVKVEPDGHYIRGLTIGAASKYIEIDVASNRVYKFSGNGAKVNEFSYSGNTVTLNTTSANVDVDAPDDAVTHTGSVGALNINNVKYDNTSATARKACYNLQANASTVNITKGSLYINFATVSDLYVKATANNQVSLIGNTSATVTNFYMGTSNLLSDVGFTSSQTVYGAYKQICFDRNTYSSNANRYIYGIEGMYLTLPVFEPSSARTTYTTLGSPMFTVPTRTNKSQILFVLWSETTDGSKSSNELYTDGKKITVADTDKTFYAMWGSNMGIGNSGTTFYVDTTAPDHYRFYNNESGTSFTYTSDSQGVGSGMHYRYYVIKDSGTNADAFKGKDRYYILDRDLEYKGARYTSCETHTWNFGTSAYTSGDLLTLEIMARNNVQYFTMPNSSYPVGKGRTNTRYILELGRTGTPTGTFYSSTYFGDTTKWKGIKDINNAKRNGCSDWYVPSIGELYQLKASGMYSKLNVNSGYNVGSSTLSDYYVNNTSYHSACQCIWVGQSGYTSSFGQWWDYDCPASGSYSGSGISYTIPIRSF